ncbi:phosphonate degradation associated HDIG domain protein [Pedobacter psychrotolerans]|uniref:Phosphodiesterase n=1 Tax=Pedobacter psychrotolerans TaxID=1843235 RepID=A0A4R2HDK8_9SPHI|nr:HD domain-containing protein [Pedobacter psychrotolerans]TCO23841.1 phosphonate degradation associated HDIG domain protein [Pedobacter psychrotolerans]GGE62968.1 phosphodiesterase [Pedobacter psychrotolerans]
MMEKSLNPQLIVDEVFALYEAHGNDDYIGEPVSQLEHMSQAANLALAEGYDDEVVLAAFFHDIGHLCAAGSTVESMDGMGNVNHEQIGADYLLARGFSARVAKLVKGHVIAKRYLTYKYPEYFDKLSPASRVTLGFQGGPMNAMEAAAFETDPDLDIIIRMRFWDDEAKLTEIPVNNINQLKAIAIAHLSNHE